MCVLIQWFWRWCGRVVFVASSPSCALHTYMFNVFYVYTIAYFIFFGVGVSTQMLHLYVFLKNPNKQTLNIFVYMCDVDQGNKLISAHIFHSFDTPLLLLLPLYGAPCAALYISWLVSRAWYGFCNKPL